MTAEDDGNEVRARRRTSFDRLDAVLGDEPVLSVDSVEAVRHVRDALDERDARRVTGHGGRGGNLPS